MGDVAADQWYRFGDGYLVIRSHHRAFSSQFERLFGGCGVPPVQDATATIVRCDVAVHGDESVIQFKDPQPLDVVAFAAQLFADRGVRERESSVPGERAFGVTSASGDVAIGVRGDALVASNRQDWQALAGNIAVHRVLRLQPHLAVLHAGAVAIGRAGVVLVGEKGRGKTTLSLALAARGHGFLADEMTALRLDTRELLPLRRSVSIRPGPRSRRVEAALSQSDLAREDFPDGPRVRARIEQLFPGNVATTVALRAIVFLRGVRSTPAIARTAPHREHLRLMTPLSSTMWGQPPAVRAIRLLGILSSARCFWLDAGDPDETAALVEQTIAASWD